LVPRAGTLRWFGPPGPLRHPPFPCHGARRRAHRIRALHV